MANYKPRVSPLTLSLALGEAGGLDDDAIAVDFDEVTKKMKSHMLVIGRYLTTQIYSVRNLFVRMRQIWHLRGGMEEKELADNKFLIRFEQKGDFNHVLRGGPWLYQDFPLLVAEYDGKSSISDVPVNSMMIWVRIMELPIGMMTEEWARKMGNQLGSFKEIPKGGRKNLWDDFYRIKVELDVTRPIRRWVKFQDSKTREMLRYEVKYERIPTFCYFCGFIGHADKNCMLPEEEKIVRFCVEQKASPYRDSDHRSYYIPADPANVKRHLQFQSRSSADWKIVHGTTLQRDTLGRVEESAEDDSEDRSATANPADVLQMVAAVEKMQVADGKNNKNNLTITAEQVTAVAKKMLKRKWARRPQAEKKTGKEADVQTNRSITDETQGSTGGYPMMVPPIESCLRPDSSLLQELRADNAHTDSHLLKMKDTVLGKRSGCNDVLMQDTEYNLGGRLGEGSEKKQREDGQITQGADEEGEKVDDQEATSQGAAGNLTGAVDRACQEP
jgi:hypothetical protein